MKESLGGNPSFVYKAPLKWRSETVDEISDSIEIGEHTPKATYQVVDDLLRRQRNGEEGVEIEFNGVPFQNGEPLKPEDPKVQAFLEKMREVNRER